MDMFLGSQEKWNKLLIVTDQMFLQKYSIINNDYRINLLSNINKILTYISQSDRTIFDSYVNDILKKHIIESFDIKKREINNLDESIIILRYNDKYKVKSEVLKNLDLNEKEYKKLLNCLGAILNIFKDVENKKFFNIEYEYVIKLFEKIVNILES